MSEPMVQSQPQAMPGRRKQPRHQDRNSAHKAYMSENDLAAVDAARHHMAPRTPEKGGYISPSASHTNRPASGKQRQKNKAGKQKNAGASTSPEPDHPHKQTATPQRAASASFNKGPSMAFAGATFHASPAPSALPMPSFLSKPGTSPSASRSMPAIVQQPSPPATDTEVPTPYRPSPGVTSSESPLDFMFRAHRQEKERQRGGPANSTPPAFSPFAAIERATSSSQSRPTPTRRISHGISSEELDGQAGQPTGPAFSTPYQDRIKAARANPSHSSPHNLQPQQQATPRADADDATEALKKFLFGGGQSSAAAQPAPEAGLPFQNNYAGHIPSPARGEDLRRDAHRGSNLQAMENDLRRLLKIDQGIDSSPVERRLFTK
jgi:hypothetical protein